MGEVKFKTNIVKRGNSLVVVLRKGDFDNADCIEKFKDDTRVSIRLEVIENEQRNEL